MRNGRRLCFIFSRYSREPFDGKQSQLFKLLPLLAQRFERIELLGLARARGDLTGAKWGGPPPVEITEVVFPGSYDVQALVCLWAKFGWFPWPGLAAIRRWVKERDHEDTTFFFEGFPLAGLLCWPRHAQVFWGEVDSYLRRAHRLRRMGTRRGLHGWLGMIAARRLESIGLSTALATQVYSDSDARFLRRIHGKGVVRGIPMPCKLHAGPPAARRSGKLPRVLIWADSSYAYLEASMRKIFEAVMARGRRGTVEYVFLVGNNEALKAQIVSAGWEAYTRVDDLDELMGGMDFVLLPDLSGTGIKNRTLNALTRGVCVIGTRIAWEGIPMKDNVHGVILRDRADLDQLVLELFAGERFKSIAQAGQELVLNRFSPSAVSSQWGKFFEAQKQFVPAIAPAVPIVVQADARD